jgi:hypothetical protein
MLATLSEMLAECLRGFNRERSEQEQFVNVL